MFVGRHAVGNDVPKNSADIEAADGCANTILVVEGGQPVPWTKPADLVYESEKALPTLGDFYKNEFYTLRGQ
jgi:hypothetical protein